MSKTHRLFISHSWKYSDQYETIIGWFNKASYFNWINYSIPITNPVDFDSKNELKQKITNKINQVNCVVILAGMYAAHSEWIDYEIDEAVRLGKPIVGVKPWGNEKMPQKIQDYADEIVNWQSSSVVDAVKDAVKRNSNA